MESLKNQAVLVTGASSGIGKSLALSLAAQGAEVWLVARRKAVLEEVAKHAETLGSRGHVCSLDLTCDDDVHNLGKRLESEAGHLNILVLCGGTIVHGPLGKFSLADVDLMYRSNLRAYHALLQATLPLLRKARGQIVFVNSTAGLRSGTNAALYSATQHAFRSTADTLREEVNADGIRVLSVYLGRVATPRTEQTFAREGRPYRPELLVQPEDVADMVIHSLRLPRTAEVTDMTIRAMLKSY